MRTSRLKGLRVLLSLLFFSATSLLFLDFRNWIAPEASTIVLYPQFLPSLMRSLQGVTLGASGFLAVLLLTAGAGRVYCSTICPLGTLQDVTGYCAARRKTRAAAYRLPHNVLRYALLALVCLFMLAGGNLLVNVLDPFSAYGRIVASLVRPVGIAVNNGTAMILENFGIYALAREHSAALVPVSFGVAVATLLLVTWMSAQHGRLYCNSICPVGTLLGLFARFSVLRLRMEEDNCISCGRCVAVCKADCIDLTAKTIDLSRCVACYNCLAVCKVNGVQFGLAGRRYLPPVKQSVEQARDPQRRTFLLNSGAYLLTLSGVVAEPGQISEKVRQLVLAKPTTVPVVRTSPVSPPGSVSVDRFTKRCTACHLCVSACPPQILLPAFLEYGVSGLMQPRMHFQTGHCTYECTICGEVCPTGAIVPLAVEQKKLTQTGVAKFIKENCVVYTDNTACGACSEHCPTKAVNMVPYPNPLNKPLGIPEVKQELCVGCGGCEHACPTRPYKAIFIDGNPVHKPAQKPIVQEVEQQVDFSEDFPF